MQGTLRLVAIAASVLLLPGCGSKSFEKLSSDFAQGVKDAVATGKADPAVGPVKPSTGPGARPEEMQKVAKDLGTGVEVVASLWSFGGRPSAESTAFWNADAVVFPDGRIAYKDFRAWNGTGEEPMRGAEFPLRESAPKALRDQVAAVHANLAGPCDLPLIKRAELEAAGLRGLNLPREPMVPTLEQRRASTCAMVKNWKPGAPLVHLKVALRGSGGTATIFTQLAHEPFSIAEWRVFGMDR